jgi:hypothetical protein
VNREVKVKGMNVVGMDVEVIMEDVEVAVASMLGVIAKVKEADCPVE